MVDPTVLLWVVVALLLVLLLTAIIIGMVQVLTPMPLYVPEARDMLYRFTEVKVDGTRPCTLLVHAALHKRVCEDSEDETKTKGKAPSHAVMLDTLLLSAKTVHDADTSAGWDTYAKAMGKKLYDDFELCGVSLEILVPDESSTSKDMQAAIYTRGSATKVLSFTDQTRV